VGPLDNVNDLRVLCKCTLYKNVQDHGLLVLSETFSNKFVVYIFGDKGYLLISWNMMTPYR
jgi:hypothetical protein